MIGRRGFIGALLAAPALKPRRTIDSGAVLQMRRVCRTASSARCPLHDDLRSFTTAELIKSIRGDHGAIPIVSELRRALGVAR